VVEDWWMWVLPEPGQEVPSLVRKSVPNICEGVLEALIGWDRRGAMVLCRTLLGLIILSGQHPVEKTIFSHEDGKAWVWV